MKTIIRYPRAFWGYIVNLFGVCLLSGVLIAYCHAAQVTLAWDAHPDPAVVGYKLYSGSTSSIYGTPVNVGMFTRYIVTDIVEGKPRYFAVTAYDAKGYESAFSAELECFTLAPSAGANGAISPAATVVVSRGMSQTFSLTTAANYSVADVLVDGVSKGAVASYTFFNVTACHGIAASFAAAVIGSLGSFNHDAMPDILWRNVLTGEICVTYMNGMSYAGMAYLPAVLDQNWTIAGTHDFNGDGSSDILWRHVLTGENCIWFMNGVTYAGMAYLPAVLDKSWTIAGTGDFNGDGKPDILWRNTSSGQNCVWYMNGVTVAGWAYLPTVADFSWTIAGTGDFNGDGKPDILWRNTSSGQNCVWYMNGVTMTGWADLPSVTDQSWTIVGTGDFNGDGKLDILWSNIASRQSYVWYMNGITYTGGASLPISLEPGWMIF